MNTKPIVVVGSSNTDMVVKSHSLPKPGQTVVGGEFLLAPGGKGANQAVAAARLGGRVRFVAKVGADLFGEEAIAGYEKEGIDTSAIVREDGLATGVALILVDGAGENMISVASGANLRWTDEDIVRIEPILREAGIVVMQLEIPLETVAAVAALADRAGVPVLLDPAPAQKLPEEILRHLTYLKPNEHEAEQLTGIPTRDKDSAARAAQKLLDQGVKEAVIITLGEQGALLLRRGGKPECIPAPKIEAVDTTAAGDAFTGALAFRLSRGAELEEAIDYANHVAALSATALGAQPSLPGPDRVDRFMKENR